MNNKSPVAWDIETTGFGATDQVTVSGFWYPAGHAELVLNTNSDPDRSQAPGSYIDGRDASSDVDLAEQRLEDLSGVPVNIRAVRDEESLLETLEKTIFERFDRERNCLVAFNAESWKGGFDLPFLRTRCIAHDKDWVFDGIRFTDLWDPIKKRINTTWTAYEADLTMNSLGGAYDLLLDEVPAETFDPGIQHVDQSTEQVRYTENAYDPFDASAEAVTAYNREDFSDVCQHNLADIHRTWELASIVREYVSSTDISTKRL